MSEQERAPSSLQRRSNRSDETSWSRRAFLLSPCPPHWGERAGTGSYPQTWRQHLNKNKTFNFMIEMKKCPMQLIKSTPLFKCRTCPDMTPAHWRGKAGSGTSSGALLRPSEERRVYGHSGLCRQHTLQSAAGAAGSASHQTSFRLTTDLSEAEEQQDYDHNKRTKYLFSIPWCTACNHSEVSLMIATPSPTQESVSRKQQNKFCSDMFVQTCKSWRLFD